MVFVNKLGRIWKVIVGKAEGCGLGSLHNKKMLLQSVFLIVSPKTEK
jgi:hypothetical protein